MRWNIFHDVGLIEKHKSIFTYIFTYIITLPLEYASSKS
jgi:hypothetical protein